MEMPSASARIALGDSLADAEFFAISLCDAHRLIALVREALEEPTPDLLATAS
jgi:hypothetical protein